MGRVNVFLKDELLEEINREAEAEGTNRSALIQKAMEDYLEAKQRKREEEERREKMREASQRIDKLAEKLGDWDPVAIIRKFRDTNLKGNS